MTKTKPLHLNRLEIESFMRIKALKVDADGQHVVLKGSNGSGKTSALVAIFETLKGHSSKAVPEPITHGAAEANIRLDLGEYIVERQFDGKGTKLVITAADGSRITRAQELLDGLLGKFSFDPVRFLSERPQDQLDIVLQAAGVAPPMDEVETITGERHETTNGESAASYLERLSADTTGTYYVRRRDAHRLVEQKRAALEEQRQDLERAGGPLKPDEAEQSATTMLRERRELQHRADVRREAQQRVDDAKRELTDGTDLLRQLRADLISEDERIADLEKQLAQRRASRAELAGRIFKGERVVEELDAERKNAEAALAKLPDVSPHIAEIDRKVQTVEADQKRRLTRQVLGQRLAALAAELEHADSDHKTLDGVMEALRGLRANLLNGVNLGIDGLEVGLGELRLGGVPFRQASQAEQIRTAAAVAMAQNPRLRLLRVDGGESLDSKSRQVLLQVAEEHNFQVIMCCVADEDGLKVEIVDAA